MIPDDPTNHDRPMRRKSHTETPITEPATRGIFFVRDTVPAMLAQWAIAVSLGVAIGMLAGCGPSDVHTAANVQADLDAIAIALDGERPSHISPEDWVAAKHALLTARGAKK